MKTFYLGVERKMLWILLDKLDEENVGWSLEAVLERMDNLNKGIAFGELLKARNHPHFNAELVIMIKNDSSVTRIIGD